LRDDLQPLGQLVLLQHAPAAASPAAAPAAASPVVLMHLLLHRLHQLHLQPSCTQPCQV
jgi:hypothetical protein